jgi:hypothetical protein
MDVDLSVEVGSGDWVDVSQQPEPQPEPEQRPLVDREPAQDSRGGGAGGGDFGGETRACEPEPAPQESGGGGGGDTSVEVGGSGGGIGGGGGPAADLSLEPEPERADSGGGGGGGLLQRASSADADAPPARIWVGSWNTAVAEAEDPDLVPGGRRTIHTFDQFVPPDCDVYIMGLQEGSPEHDGEYFFSQLSRYLRERHGVEQVALPAGQVDRIYGRGDGSFVMPKFTGMRVYCSSR